MLHGRRVVDKHAHGAQAKELPKLDAEGAVSVWVEGGTRRGEFGGIPEEIVRRNRRWGAVVGWGCVVMA
jgi:hypothetical protein